MLWIEGSMSAHDSMIDHIWQLECGAVKAAKRKAENWIGKAAYRWKDDIALKERRDWYVVDYGKYHVFFY